MDPTEINKMHCCVKPGMNKDQFPREHVQPNMVIQGKDPDQSNLPHDSQRVSQYQYQEHHRIEVQTDPIGSCKQHPDIGIGAVNVLEREKDDASVDKQTDADTLEHEQEPGQAAVGSSRPRSHPAQWVHLSCQLFPTTLVELGRNAPACNTG